MNQPSYHEEDLGNTPDALVEEYGLSPVLVREITRSLEDESGGPRIHDLLIALHPADLAELISLLNSEQRAMLIAGIRSEFDAEVLTHLDPEIRDEILSQLGTEKSAEVISELDTDDAVEVISDLSAEEQKEIIDAIEDQETREEVKEALSYPEHSAGRLMQTDMVSIEQGWNVGQTIDYLRTNSEHLPTDFYAVFVVDSAHRPIASVMLSRIMQNNRDVSIDAIMNTDLKPFAVEVDQEEVAYVFRKYALVEAPVIDAQGVLVGVITVDDVVHVIQEESEEDLLRLGGISQQDFHAGVFDTVKRRLPWLMINIITAFFASRIIGAFEGSIEKLVTLAVLMPIVASIGGNAGTQVLTVAVRAITMRELKSTNALALVRKEVLTGFTNGLCIAAITSSAIGLWYHDVKLAAVFGAALIINLIVAALAGSLIPLFFNRMKQDPAITSGIFLTMLTDTTGFFAFLGLATIFLV
jgi:magnesium transporter